MTDPQEIQRIKQRLGIIGNTKQLNRDIEIAVQVAKTDLTVLITGESGVGKEHFPQIIHQYSPRKHGPYFAVNCGAIPEGTIDSELFGHEKGSFTDARQERKGYFEIADGGTLFLDEVGELPLPTQVRLLRVLETGEFLKVGSSKVQKTNVRVVAATNLDMKSAIETGRFREDLYYRLNTIEIHIPPLRERKDDIPVLFRKFSVDFAERYSMPPIRLTEDAVQLLRNYYWKGNIRQLKNVAEQISIIETQREINADTLRQYLPEDGNGRPPAIIGRPSDNQAFLNEREILMYQMIVEMKKDIDDLRRQVAATPSDKHLIADPVQTTIVTPPSATQPIINHTPHHANSDDYEAVEEVTQPEPQKEPLSMKDANKEMIIQALQRNGMNRKQTAAELGISERTLYRKIRDYQLNA